MSCLETSAIKNTLCAIPDKTPPESDNSVVSSPGFDRASVTSFSSSSPNPIPKPTRLAKFTGPARPHWNPNTVLKTLRNWVKEPQNLRVYVRPADFAEAWERVQGDKEAWSVLEDKIRLDYDPLRELLLVYMPSELHEAGITVLSKEVEFYLKEVVSALDPICAKLVSEIEDKRSTDIVVPISRDPSYEPGTSSPISAVGEGQLQEPVTMPGTSPRPRYTLRQKSPRRLSSSRAMPEGLASPTPSPQTISILCPDTSWRHDGDILPRVVVESAKAQDLSDLERKVERYICEAGVNVVIGLIISQGKRRYESDFEEGSCVLKIWTVIDDKDRDREVHLAENTKLLNPDNTIVEDLPAKLYISCSIVSFLRTALLVTLTKETPTLGEALDRCPNMQLDLHKLAEAVAKARNPPSAIDISGATEQELSSIRDRWNPRKRKNATLNEVDNIVYSLASNEVIRPTKKPIKRFRKQA